MAIWKAQRVTETELSSICWLIFPMPTESGLGHTESQDSRMQSRSTRGGLLLEPSSAASPGAHQQRQGPKRNQEMAPPLSSVEPGKFKQCLIRRPKSHHPGVHPWVNWPGLQPPREVASDSFLITAFYKADLFSSKANKATLQKVYRMLTQHKEKER